MLKTLRNAWAVPELRQKMLFTLFILLLYRVGAAIPVPFITATGLKVAELGGSGSIFSYLNILSGDAFSKGTLFALAVSPYITAQIVIQLLAVAIPALEKLSKQGEEGRKKLERITRYLTVGLALITAFGYYKLLNSTQMRNYYGEIVTQGSNKFENVFIAVTIILCYTAGASLIMWLAEKIDEQGIGNGISMILFANILCGIPSTIASFSAQITEYLKKDNSYVAVAVVLSILAILVVLASIIFMVYMTDAERRIPVQYAKRVVGRKMYGGQNSNLPIKLNMSGVMPIIFASTIVSLPVTIIYLCQPKEGGFWSKVQHALSSDNWIYAVVLFVLIIAFAYFYISISFNPVEVANNLMQQGGSIPGIRPGKPTAQYIQKVLNKVVLMGAFFLGIIACVPLIINIISTELFSVGIGVVSFSGSSLLIVVGVALETIRDMESQLAMRHYKGFLQ
ncbi:MAG: preprotein translocase subunit SecY [Eubacteriales bacterium]|nr:preprotein translocase subunit SecY [Eubacterium sp.]MDD7572735.1 preprotein translocase subunit SecY [Eubacteriales bacterium]MDY5355533.1 preprotein translocase subunit SecY [Eubacteriales bacterium]